jgi:hypothetical protein
LPGRRGVHSSVLYIGNLIHPTIAPSSRLSLRPCYTRENPPGAPRNLRTLSQSASDTAWDDAADGFRACTQASELVALYYLLALATCTQYGNSHLISSKLNFGETIIKCIFHHHSRSVPIVLSEIPYKIDTIGNPYINHPRASHALHTRLATCHAHIGVPHVCHTRAHHAPRLAPRGPPTYNSP